MRFGLCLDPRRSWDDTVQLARRAENNGMARVYVADHFMRHHPTRVSPGPVQESWTTLSALAAITTQIGLGTLVLGNAYRHPAVVANMAATLDQLSGGRLLLGLGAGWQANEHMAYGIELRPPSTRMDCFEEALQVISLLLRSDLASFDGSYYTLRDARCEPGPLQRPLPLLIGGAGERRSIPLAVRYADAWHAWSTPEQFRHKSAVLDAACLADGRAPSDVRRLTGQVIRILDSRDTVGDEDDIIGSVAAVTEQLAAYQAAGVDEFVVRDDAAIPLPEAMDTLSHLASDVAPELQSWPGPIRSASSSQPAL